MALESEGEVAWALAPVPQPSDIEGVAEGIGARLARTCRRWSRRLQAEEGDVGEAHLDALARVDEESMGEVAPRKGERAEVRHRRWLGSQFGVVEGHWGNRWNSPMRVVAPDVVAT